MHAADRHQSDCICLSCSHVASLFVILLCLFTHLVHSFQMVYLLEEDYEQMTLCKDYSTKYNPLKPLGGLLFGMIALAIGALWIVHVSHHSVTNVSVARMQYKTRHRVSLNCNYRTSQSHSV
jgi:hypothetical protein